MSELLFFVLVGLWSDLHCKIELLQIMDMRYTPPLVCHMVSEMVSLRYLHWESGNLADKQEVR